MIQNSEALIYAIPATLVLGLKALFLFRLNIKTELSRAFAILCITVVLQNAAEVAAYIAATVSIDLAKNLVSFYMYATYFLVAAGLHFALSLTGNSTSWSKAILATLPFLFVALQFFELSITGWQLIKYALIRVAGPYYFAFELYAIFTTGTGLFLLGWYSLKGESYDIRTRSMVTFFGALLFSIVSLAIMIMMHIGWEVSTAIALPLCTLVFLATAALATRNEILDLSNLVVALTSNILKIARDFFLDDKLPLFKKMERYEAMLLMRAYNKTNGHQAEMAGILGVSPATVTRKMQRFRIKSVTSDQSEIC